MAASRSSPSWLSFVFATLALLSFSVPANALYFYMDGRQTKCFFEDLPKDTLVVGKCHDLVLLWHLLVSVHLCFEHRLFFFFFVSINLTYPSKSRTLQDRDDQLPVQRVRRGPEREHAHQRR